VFAISSTTVPVGEVAFPVPAVGTFVAAGSSVNLFMSGVTVPAVTGQAKAAAQSAITGAGLTVGAVTRASSQTVPVGSVISQNPAAGDVVLVATAVDLVVSAIPVPDVVNQVLGTGEAVIAALNLTVGNVTPVSGGTVAPGNIVSESPAGGTLVDAGTAVDIVVSGITVPDETGQPSSVAGSAITAAGLAVGNVTQAASGVVASGVVISENPAGGAIVTPGTPVDLVISTGIGQLIVPDVVGFTQGNATKAIQNTGLLVGAVTMATSASVSAGSVISESPAAGSPVNAGAAVSLVVSSGSSLQSIRVTLVNPSIVPGMTVQFTATGTLNGTTQNLTNQVIWSSTVTGVATINAGGLAIGVAVGSSTIKATLGSVSASTVLTVAAPAACDTNHDGLYTAADVQGSINQALGLSAPGSDLNGDGVVNAADVQIATNAVLAMGCVAL